MNMNQSFPFEIKAPPQRGVLAVWLRKRRGILLFVLLPTLLAALYYAFAAADIYTSESRFVIKSADQKRGSMSTIASLIQTTGLSGGQEQTNEVMDFIRSRDALAQLESDIGVRQRFVSPKGDLFSRFPQFFEDSSFESLYKYYGKVVGARLDTETSAAVVTVKAFTPRDAFEINKQLLNLSERLINRLNARARERAISEAQSQVNSAIERARSARLMMATYRNSRELIDPAKQATGVIEIANTFIAQRAAMQAQLANMVRLAPAHPAIPALRQQIAALSAQIEAQNSRVVGDDNGIASKLGGYENLFVEQQFANENLTAANASLVQARAESDRQQFYLERIVEANLPDTPLFPKRFLGVLTVLAAAACLYFIGWMLIVGILEHSPEE